MVPQDATYGKSGEESPQNRSLALIAAGSNQHFRDCDATSVLMQAIHSCSAKVGPIRRQSDLYETPAFPAGSGPNFVNAAIAIETALSAEACLAQLHAIETDFGRKRDTRWGPRTLDLDLIALGATVLPHAAGQQAWVDLPLELQMKRTPEELVLPHPRLQERAFVLVPLSDVAPDWVHPLSGHSVAQMRAALPEDEVSAVKRLDSALVKRS